MRQANTIKRPIMQSNPQSPYSEIYRTLRFNISCLSHDRKLTLISITSAGREEGRTTTAVNLAIAAAQSGKRVLLVDADLRNPAVHLAFPGLEGPGISDYLSRQAELRDIVAASVLPNLWVIKAGPLPPNPSELLSSERMASMLATLKPAYDLVLIDTPPLLTLTDAKMLAAACDGVLLVVEHGKVKRETALKVKEILSHIKADLLGIVLSKMNRNDAKAYLYTS